MGRPVIKRFQDIGDEEPSTVLGAGELREVANRLAEGLGLAPGSIELTRVAVRQRRRETRLKFNAPTPVDNWILSVEAGSSEAPVFSGEAEFFHWLTDGVWELVELVRTP